MKLFLFSSLWLCHSADLCDLPYACKLYTRSQCRASLLHSRINNSSNKNTDLHHTPINYGNYVSAIK